MNLDDLEDENSEDDEPIDLSRREDNLKSL